MNRHRGELLYKCYKTLTTVLSPLLRLHLRLRRLRGLEHYHRWPERLGRASIPRSEGPLVWFHAVSLGEGMAAVPVIEQCVKERPDLSVLMTTTTVSAFKVLKNLLPPKVMYQFAPVDIPACVDAFIGYWKPNAIILVESELWPNLIMSASRSGIKLALINARISKKSLKRWTDPVAAPLIALMLSKFTLIIPLSKAEAVHFQLLHAPPLIICKSCDLKYCTAVAESDSKAAGSALDLPVDFDDRMVWMASSIHKGEEKVKHRLVLLILPAIPISVLSQAILWFTSMTFPFSVFKAHAKGKIAENEGLKVALRSRRDELIPETAIYLVDTLGELRDFYRLTPIAVIGGSFLPGLSGHNISEAAAAGCAVLTGNNSCPCVGQFSHMVSAMKHQNPLAVLQVSGEADLGTAIGELLSDQVLLEARRAAAKQAFHALSTGVDSHVWNLLCWHLIGETPRSI
ncbi:putative 3-deoxy-D-manno-octulosonic acid transferase, mitochondrial [Drosera capensis]